MLRLDAALAVEQRVEEREPDRVRLGAGSEIAGDPIGGLGELRVGMPPQLARGGVELELPGGLCVLDGGGEVAGQACAFERFRVRTSRFLCKRCRYSNSYSDVCQLVTVDLQ